MSLLRSSVRRLLRQTNNPAPALTRQMAGGGHSDADWKKFL